MYKFKFKKLQAFEKGIIGEFFSIWNRIIPVSLRYKDEKTAKLEFYLHVYFAIYNIHPLFKKSQNIDKNNMNYFKNYIDTKG